MKFVPVLFSVFFFLGACGQSYKIDVVDELRDPSSDPDTVGPDATPPGGTPGTPPGGNPGTPPGSNPGTPPGANPGTPPGGSNPGTPPIGTNPGTPPSGNPGTPPGGNPGTPPGGNPGTPPGGNPGTPPGGTNPGTPPGGTNPGTPPGGNPGTPPGGNPGTPPGGNPGTPPGGNPGTPPGGTNPGTPPGGTNPGTPPGGTNPGTPPGGNPGTPPGGNPGTPPGGSNPPGTPGEPPIEVCDPFGDPSEPIPSGGPQINGKLYAGIPHETEVVGGKTVRKVIPSVEKFFQRTSGGQEKYLLNSSLFFSSINAPERAFDKGFYNLDGDTVKKPNSSQVLTEHFAISLRSNIKLDRLSSKKDEPGHYQFAVLADDGAIFELSDDGTKLVLNNDGEHSPTLRCATKTINMNGNTRLPFKLDYYQGPRIHIALVLLWRFVPAGKGLKPEEKCLPDVFSKVPSKERDKYIVWQGYNPSPRRGEYDQLLARGWKPLRPSNFELDPDGLTPPPECRMKKK